MTKVYVFPGQGPQRKGMGAQLFDAFPELTAQADTILGYSIKELCVNGPDQQLRDTRYTQPALFVVKALTYLHKLRQDPATPDFVAGTAWGNTTRCVPPACSTWPPGYNWSASEVSS
jgi:malonyl CoA-acyl carrier protein transacylase